MKEGKLEINQLTTRKIGFISDPALQLIILDLLKEIDNVFGVSAFRSALYLSVSAMEGILKHVLKLNQIKAQKWSKYPKVKGKLKKIEDLNLFECIPICSEISLIPQWLEKTYDQLRVFRNYIHPELELLSRDNINIGISEIAIGILNNTLLHLDCFRFIEGATWKVISGCPAYSLSNSKLRLLRVSGVRTCSFITTKHYMKQDFNIEFDAIFHGRGILNFVYNFASEENFLMIRIDKREKCDDGLLVCTKKHFWRTKAKFIKSPDLDNYEHRIYIKIVGNSLEFNVDGSKLQIENGNWDYNPAMGIGFFNEGLEVDIENLRVT